MELPVEAIGAHSRRLHLLVEAIRPRGGRFHLRVKAILPPVAAILSSRDPFQNRFDAFESLPDLRLHTAKYISGSGDHRLPPAVALHEIQEDLPRSL